MSKKSRKNKVQLKRHQRRQHEASIQNYNSALDAYNNEDWETALKYAEKVLDIHPEDVDALKIAALSARQLEQFEKSADLCIELSIVTNELFFIYDAAYSFAQIKNYRKALECYEIVFEKMQETGTYYHDDISINEVLHNIEICKRNIAALDIPRNLSELQKKKTVEKKKTKKESTDQTALDFDTYSESEDKQTQSKKSPTKKTDDKTGSSNQFPTLKPVTPQPENLPFTVRPLTPDFKTYLQPIEYLEPFEYKELHHVWQDFKLQETFDQLICLADLHGVEHHNYQLDTVKKILKTLKGRVLLADEVGLGKTIEAGIALKEYLLRDMVHRVLILTPSSLVSQWRLEMREKMGLKFVTTEQKSLLNKKDFWKTHPQIIASISTAKSTTHFEKVTELEWDLVIVDEAHCLRNKNTKNWKLVNELKKRFIFLLTATPVQNNLIELYTLFTLLKPGILSTANDFRMRYMMPGSTRIPKNAAELQELLSEVMVRNTRSLAEISLPPRHATTISVSMDDVERELYNGIVAYIREFYHQTKGLQKMKLQLMQQMAGSSPAAVTSFIETMLKKKPHDREQLEALRNLGQQIQTGAKVKALLKLLHKKKTKMLVFSQFTETLNNICEVLEAEQITFEKFMGGMSGPQKDRAVERFRDDVDILVCSETGGEGRNLQFCQTMVNFDLPWNPMRLEQRIGRIHRFGQSEDVFLFNLCLKGSIEEKILYILDEKINMFELVVGEIGDIIGSVDEDIDFDSFVMSLWAAGEDEHKLNQEFEEFGEKLLKGKKKYEKTKELDQQLFGEDYEA